MPPRRPRVALRARRARTDAAAPGPAEPEVPAAGPELAGVADPVAQEVLEADEADGEEGDLAEALRWRDDPGAGPHDVLPVQVGWAPGLGALTTPTLPSQVTSGPLADAVRRRPRRRWLLAPAAAVVLAVALLGFVLLRAEREVPRLVVRVQVDGAPLEVRVPEPVTVGSALATAGVTPRPARLLSAATRRVLDPALVPASVTLDGLEAPHDAPVRKGQTIAVANPPDQTEAVVTKTSAVPPPVPPEVESGLWHPGRPGETVVQLGERSGEEVGREVRAAPLAPVPVTGKLVALTFDDGPHPTFTPAVLRVLRDKGVKAMFCVVGQEVRRHGQIVQAEVADGHALCNHTMDHDQKLVAKPAAVQERNIGALDDLFRERGIEPPVFYRPPGGHLSPGVVAAARKHGHRVLKWTVDPNDYTKPGPQQIVDRVMAQLRPGGVILLHDGGGDRSQTLAALPGIIDSVRGGGYTFVRPDQVPPV